MGTCRHCIASFRNGLFIGKSAPCASKVWYRIHLSRWFLEHAAGKIIFLESFELANKNTVRQLGVQEMNLFSKVREK